MTKKTRRKYDAVMLVRLVKEEKKKVALAAQKNDLGEAGVMRFLVRKCVDAEGNIYTPEIAVVK